MWKLQSYDENKLNFHELDRRVKNIPDSEISTLPDLVDKLISWLPKDNTHQEIYLMRGFAIWLRAVRGRKLAGEDPTIPAEIVDLFENNYNNNILEAFCRAAKIESQIIKGITKTFDYRAGDSVETTGLKEKLTGVWFAFRCNGQWHIILGFGVVSGHQKGDEIKLEMDGHTDVKKKEASSGEQKVHERELWFCTNPLLASFTNYPLDDKWQLLPSDNKITSLEGFFGLPYYRDALFYGNIRLLSDNTCKLLSRNGRNTIDFMINGSKSISTRFTYELRFIGDESSLPNPSDLPLLVFQTREDNVVTFEIRYPILGMYHFVIYIKTPDMETFENACSFHLTCTEIDTNLKKIPVDTGANGFGFNDSAEESGLSRPSTAKAKLVVKPSDKGCERQKLTFDLDEDIANHTEYISTVYSSSTAEDGSHVTSKSRDFTKTEKSETDGKLVVDVGVETDGEYCLAIGSRQSDTDDAFLLFMYYLISSEEDPEEEYRLAELKRKRRGLRSDEKVSVKKKIKADLEAQLDMLTEEVGELQKHCIRSIVDDGIDVEDINIQTDFVEREAQTDEVEKTDISSGRDFVYSEISSGTQTDFNTTKEQSVQTDNQINTVGTQTTQKSTVCSLL